MREYSDDQNRIIPREKLAMVVGGAGKTGSCETQLSGWRIFSLLCYSERTHESVWQNANGSVKEQKVLKL